MRPSSTSRFSVMGPPSHEFGHTLGLKHTPDARARMHFAYPNGGWFHEETPDAETFNVLAKDRRDIRAVYPGAGVDTSPYASNVFYDLGVFAAPCSMPGA